MLISRLIKYYIELCALKPKGRFRLHLEGEDMGPNVRNRWRKRLKI